MCLVRPEKRFGMVVYWEFGSSTVGSWSDHHLLRPYRGFIVDPGFITEATTAAMVKLLNENCSEADVKWREFCGDVSGSLYRAAVFTDFMACFGRTMEEGDVVRAFVYYKVQ